MQTLADIEREATKLPDRDRASLASRLLDSLPAVLSDDDDGLAEAIQTNPKRFHGVPGNAYRRANFPSFPYHLIFRETADGARVLVLRHHRRHPDFGMERK
jgi:hypothetical protein